MEGKSIKSILQDLRRQQAESSAETVLKQIDLLLSQWKSKQIPFDLDYVQQDPPLNEN